MFLAESPFFFISSPVQILGQAGWRESYKIIFLDSYWVDSRLENGRPKWTRVTKPEIFYNIFGSILGPQTSFPPFFRMYRLLSHIPTSDLWSSDLWSSDLWSSDLWVVGLVAVGLVGRRTYGHRICGPSDLWTSDLCAVGLVGLRTCGMSPSEANMCGVCAADVGSSHKSEDPQVRRPTSPTTHKSDAPQVRWSQVRRPTSPMTTSPISVSPTVLYIL